MDMTILKWLLVFAPPIVHEFGHWVAALLLGSPIRFYRSGWRFLWDWPDVSREKLIIINQAGFGLELLLVPFLPLQYGIVAILHFLAYPHYAGTHSDFKGMI